VHALRASTSTCSAASCSLLVGPSGCGKTTLISVMAGILDQTEGGVARSSAGPAAHAGGPATRFRGHNIGFVFQAFNCCRRSRPRRTWPLPLLILGVPRRQALERAHEACAR